MSILSRLGSLRRRPIRLPTQVAYDLWAPVYLPTAHNALMRAEQDIVEQLLAPLRPRRALDVGTGSGRYLPVLAATGATLVVGLDLSFAMLAQHRGTTPRVCGDACRLPVRNAAFDLINASLMTCDVSDLRAWAGELSRVLMPGGHLIYSDLHPSWAANRWRRTFRAADGRHVDVPYVPHDLGDHHRALRHAGLDVVQVRVAGIPEDPMPAVAVVFHAMKPGPGAD